jgi:polygalacturonase
MDAKLSDGKHNNPRLIQINKGNNFTIYRITMNNSPHYHVVPSSVNGFIAWGVKLHTPTTAYPKYNDTTVKNTDGIDPSGSSNVVIAYSYISTGDDNIAIKSDSGHSSNILIAHSHFYKGHGMSIGSGTSKGVSNVIVRDLSLDGTVTGLQIKSDSTSGGLVTGITYEQICIRNVDSPLVFNAYYSNNTGSLYPDFQNIKLSGVHILSSNKKKVVFRGYDAKYPLKITLDHVVSDVVLNDTIASDALITDGKGAVTNVSNVSKENLLHLISSSKETTPIDCSKAFPSFPSLN